MPFNSEIGGHNAAPDSDRQQQASDSQVRTNALEDLRVVSLDPKYPDDEQCKRFKIFDDQIDDMFDASRFAEARALIELMIEDFSGNWRPVEEREDCLIRAFWVKDESVAFRRAHPTLSKPLLWGVPSLSKLFYLQSCTYSRELRFDLAHACLRRGFECEPDHPGLWLAEGTLLNWEKRLEEALEAYRTAATIRSWTEPVVVSRCIYGQGIALGSLRRLPEAREAFARALELDPDDARAKSNLERVEYDLWRLRTRESSAPKVAYRM